MTNRIYSVTALDRKDDEMRLFIGREICIEYLIKNWGNNTNFWDYCMDDFADWCIDHIYESNVSFFKEYMKDMLNKNIHYFDDYELFKVNCFHRYGLGAFCKVS